MTYDIEAGQRWMWRGKMRSRFFLGGATYEVLSVSDDVVYVEDKDGRASNDGRGHCWPAADFIACFAKAADAPAKPPIDVREAIAQDALRIVNGDRRGAYGTPERNFERIARFWQAYFENTGRGDAKITAADISPLMRLMKEARLCESPKHRDSHVDLIGYTLTGAEVNGVDAVSGK